MNFLVNNKGFIMMAIISIILTFMFASYMANLLFGKNSYEVYSNLRKEKKQLQSNIQQLQMQNAALQKQYLELKNLEPEPL